MMLWLLCVGGVAAVFALVLLMFRAMNWLADRIGDRALIIIYLAASSLAIGTVAYASISSERQASASPSTQPIARTE